MPPKNAILNRAGPAVQHVYLVSFLRLLCRYECMRTYTVAFAMFPTRTQSAALAAAQRVVTNANKKGYIHALNWMDGRRYYALSPKGARFLNELDPEYCARSTVSALSRQNKNHRDWSVLIAIASEHRQFSGFSESLIAGDMHNDITSYFGHIPDAVTVMPQAAIWHEVETSRRSTTRRVESPNALCGAEKLVHLVQTLRVKHVLTHHGKTYPVMLAMHCAGDKIEREVRALIEKAISPFLWEKKDYGYDVAREGSQSRSMMIIVNSLPLTPEDGAWTDVLPWAMSPGEPKSDVDRFVQRQS